MIDRRWKKRAAFLLGDAIIVAASVLVAFALRFDGSIPVAYQPHLLSYILLSILCTIPALAWQRLYSFTWAYVSLYELIEVFQAVVLSGLLFTVAYLVLGDWTLFQSFPRSVIVIETVLNFIFIGGLRAGKRVAQFLYDPNLVTEKNKPTIIAGAGDQAEQLIRMLHGTSNPYRIIGLLDNHINRKGIMVHGIPVLGTMADLPKLTKTHSIETLIIALGEANRQLVRQTVHSARENGIQEINILPSIHELLSGNITLKNIRPVNVEDLLGREPAAIETQEIARFLSGKDVLVTGAAGSIGSELCRQISKFSPRTLYLLDYEESNLFALEHALKNDVPLLHSKPIIADIRNEQKIRSVFERFQPSVVFHAAAYKHVPMMEEYPDEAVMTNVVGTLTVAKAAADQGVEKFVLISTDKAVRPKSVMGKTKKLAEMVIQSLNEHSSTQFVAVRFGNVLGSRGSVLPIFEEQIRRRQPVTITDPSMTRYFMSIPEAVLLVMEAGAIGEGGEVFILDMGKPVRILDLAREVIRLSGLVPDKDIPIVYTSARPGEKIFEEILTDEEGTVATRYQKIYRTRARHILPLPELIEHIDVLLESLSDHERLRTGIDELLHHGHIKHSDDPVVVAAKEDEEIIAATS